jgi:hypothetical protein
VQVAQAFDVVMWSLACQLPRKSALVISGVVPAGRAFTSLSLAESNVTGVMSILEAFSAGCGSWFRAEYSQCTDALTVSVDNLSRD